MAVVGLLTDSRNPLTWKYPFAKSVLIFSLPRPTIGVLLELHRDLWSVSFVIVFAHERFDEVERRQQTLQAVLEALDAAFRGHRGGMERTKM